MIDINWVVEHKDKFVLVMQKRNFNVNVDTLLEVNSRRIEAQKKYEECAAKKNKIAKEIGAMMAQLKAGNITQADVDAKKKEGDEVGEELKKLDAEAQARSQELQKLLEVIPNMVADEVPFGKDDSENFTLRKWGEPTKYDFQPLEHSQLGINTGTLDFERAVKMSGARFTIMRGKVAKLERMLRNFMTNICVEAGYEEIVPPFMVNAKAAYNAGQLPKFEEDIFKTTEGHYLIPTAETALVNMYAGEIIDEKDLPIRICAYSPCFRSEAGSAGKDTTGMIRQHQFTKVEIVSITAPEKQNEEHERMLGIAESILQKLELPYRVVVLCGGDIGFCSTKTYDLEVWLPGQNKYREICSCSCTTNFQSRRANIRMKRADGRKEYPYMYNSSALAIGRTIVALMENNQTADGKVDFDRIFELVEKGL